MVFDLEAVPEIRDGFFVQAPFLNGIRRKQNRKSEKKRYF